MKRRSKRNVILENDTENAMARACEQQGTLRKIETKNTLILRFRKRLLKILEIENSWTHHQERGFGEFDVHMAY